MKTLYVLLENNGSGWNPITEPMHKSVPQNLLLVFKKQRPESKFKLKKARAAIDMARAAVGGEAAKGGNVALR